MPVAEPLATEATKQSEVTAATTPEQKAPEQKVQQTLTTPAPEIVYDLKVPKEMPEGHTLDDKVLETYKNTVKELKLSNEHAQTVLDKVMPAMAQRAEELQQKQRTEWAEAAKRDQEYGGQAFDDNLKSAQIALQKFGSKELVEMLDRTGLGNHPEWIRAWFKVGKLMREDRFVAADKAAPADPNDDASMAKKLYPNSK